MTFLFTDVEGSTRLLHELGDRYADVLAAHRRALREAFRAHRGYEVDTQGDSFLYAFQRASDAAKAAGAAQAALAGGPVKVRMGLHTGEPIATEEGYVGIGAIVDPLDQEVRRVAVEAALAAQTEDEFASAWQAGRELQENEAVELARAAVD